MRNNTERLHRLFRLHYGAGEWIYRAHINNSDLRLEGETNSRRAHWYIHKKNHYCLAVKHRLRPEFIFSFCLLYFQLCIHFFLSFWCYK